MNDGRVIEMTGPMRRVQARIEQPLEDYLRASYASLTLEGIAADLESKGVKVSQSTLHRWMRSYGIEARFPGQRPTEAATS